MNNKFTGVVLAGGKSLRMGKDKALLSVQGKSLLEQQITKLIDAGAAEVLVSGNAYESSNLVRCISDVYPDRGPLGGIHACLEAALHPQCLFITVDMPLLSTEILHTLIDQHTAGVTILQHENGIEPLVGVYDKTLASRIEALIQKGSAPVRALFSEVPCRYVEYNGPKDALINCNTPQEYQQILSVLETKKLQLTDKIIVK